MYNQALLDYMREDVKDTYRRHHMHNGLWEYFPQLNCTTKIVFTDKTKIMVAILDAEPLQFPYRYKSGGLLGFFYRILGGLLGWRKLVARGYSWYCPPPPQAFYRTVKVVRYVIQISEPLYGWKEPTFITYYLGYDPLNDVLYVYDPVKVQDDSEIKYRMVDKESSTFTDYKTHE